MSSPSVAVLETLQNACSQDPYILKPAEKQLQEWEVHPGFYTILTEIFLNHSIDVNVRWLAVLYCKNGVEKYWRKTAPNAMKDEEKELLKERLISNFNEPVHQIATQLAVLVAKIARVECPRNWSKLLPVLFETVRCPDEAMQEQALLILHHVTKTLASKRLPPDRKLFEELTNDIFGFILTLWNTNLDQFGQLAVKQCPSINTSRSLDKTILALRIMRKQIAFGFREPGENADVSNFLKQIFTRLKEMLDCRQSMWGNHQIIEKCEKMIILLTKVLLDLVDLHPMTFVPLIRPSLEFTVAYNFSQSEKGLLFERFTVNCFNLMKSILLCDIYKPLRNNDDLTEPLRLEACKVKTEFFTYGTLTEICQRLVSQYFLLSSEDLNTWDSDPEEFCQEEVGDSYRYSLKPCTECLFLALFKENRMSLSPVLISLVQQIQTTVDPNDIMAVLRKDAVYNAVGLSAFDLFDDINFDEWFTKHLVIELQNKHVNYRIIRRRVIWLCAQWVGVKMSASLRPDLYQVIIPLLRKDEDLVVRIEAAQTLKTVDDFEFSVDQFLPFLENMFTLLFELLQEVRECDTKMQVLHVISFVIERVGPKIQQYATSLIQYLPGLWHQSGDHNMLRCAILTTLIHLVQGFGSGCSVMFDFLLPVIQMSTDVTQDQYIYLVEDGLELWHATLQNITVSTDHVLRLYDNMAGLLELGTENLRICLKVIEDYILLCPLEFMQHYSTVLVNSLGKLLPDVKTEGQILVLRVIEVVFKTFPKEGTEAFSPMLPTLLNGVLFDKEEHPLMISMYMTLLARVLLQNQEYMFNFFNTVASEIHKDSESVLGMFIDVLSEKIDSITQPEKRKLCALSLISLLSLNLNVIKAKFCAIICLCVEVLHDVTRIPVDEDPSIQLDSLVINDEGFEEENEYYSQYGDPEAITEHDRRKTKLSKKDPVHTIALRDYLFSQLRACQLVHGDSVFAELMETVDAEIVKQLQEFNHVKS